MTKKTKEICKAEYWMIRCKCKRCTDLRESHIRLYTMKVWSDASAKIWNETWNYSNDSQKIK